MFCKMGSIGNWNAGYRAKELELAAEVVDSIDEAISDIQKLIQKWRDEAEEIRNRRYPMGYIRNAKEMAEIRLLEKCANELEEIL